MTGGMKCIREAGAAGPRVLQHTLAGLEKWGASDSAVSRGGRAWKVGRKRGHRVWEVRPVKNR